VSRTRAADIQATNVRSAPHTVFNAESAEFCTRNKNGVILYAVLYSVLCL